MAVCFELHPGEDLHDGVTFERFLGAVDNHVAACILYDPSHFVLQQLDYLAYIDHYHTRIRSPGDGQVDFTQVFSKFAQSAPPTGGSMILRPAARTSAPTGASSDCRDEASA